MVTNYKQLFAKRKKNEERIRNICPDMKDISGIYIFHKIDELGFKKYYAGQSVKILSRCRSHLEEYDHIALSLKKYGFKKEGNPYGWELDYFYCSVEELDQKEQETIAHWHIDLGYIPYNITAGGQKSKVGINDNKPSKTYRDGLRQGELNLKRKLNAIIEKYLIINTKTDSKYAQNGLQRFYDLLQIDDEVLNNIKIGEK